MIYRIKEFFREIKYFYQRGKRGYSDRDLWDVNYYLATIIPPMMRYYIEWGSGCPTSLYDQDSSNRYHRWTKILNQIAEGFDKYIEKEDGFYWDPTPEETKEALRLFSKYFGSFWD